MRTFCVLWLRKLLCFVLAFLCISAKAQLHADFTSNIQKGCSPLIVQFTNTSTFTGNTPTWFWDLGNGATSVEKDPSAIYIYPGNYTVKLHIKNSSGEDSNIKTDYVTVYDDPVINFTAQPTVGCAPLNVQFNDKSNAGSGTINNWIWDFGDGITSTDKNPSHVYNIADTFSVTLTATNSFGCTKTLQQPSLVKVGDLIIDSFTYTYSNICNAPVDVSFKNLSQSNSNLTYQWIFGDGFTSTQKNPQHTYTTSGNFTVTLITINASGCSKTYEEVLSIGAAKADFIFTDACVNKPVVFTDNSSPISLSRTWDFGDGTTDTGYQVQHIYANAGTYQVTIDADFGGCTDTTRKTIKTGEKINPDFTATGKKTTCTYPVNIQFNNTTVGASAYTWLFGDGSTSTQQNPQHTYNAAGDYTVTLIAYSTKGCPDTIVKNNLIQLGPPKINGIANLPFTGCAPQTFTFHPLISQDAKINSYKWDFGDSSTSSDSVPSHLYKNAGVYNVTLIVTTDEGCSDSVFFPNAVTLGKAPTAKFKADPLDACAETSIEFTDQSTGLITDWLWLFGDGNSSAEQNPSHIYSDTGYKDVTLIVSQYGCYDTLELDKYIFIKPPVAKFNFSTTCDDPFTYNFKDTSIDAKTWHWDFGDNSTADVKDIKHTYTAKGLYYVALTVTNGNCSFTKHDSINVVKENPSFSYESLSSNFCKYDSIHFFATDYDSVNIKTFQWNFDDGIITSASYKNNEAYHYYANAKTYTPLLIVKDINNCIDTINKNAQVVIYGPKAAFTNKAGDCIASTITFRDQSKTDGRHAITKWIWNYGDSTNSDTLAASPFTHTYIDKGLYNVQLKIFDNNGCYDTVTNIAAINITKPVASFSATDTVTCSGTAVQFIDSSDGVSMQYNWSFGDGLNSNKLEPLHNYSDEGIYNVQLSLKDKYGCTDTLIKPQFIRVANPVAGFLLADSLFLCPPVKINPGNTSSNFTSLTWDFGDGNTSTEIAPEHFYTAPGNFNLQLIAKGYGNCYDTLTKLFVLKGPFAQLSYGPFAGCNPLNVSFSAKAKSTVEYIWDFGDGVTHASTDSNTNYSYLKPGKFLPQLVVVDSGGCRVPVVNADTVTVFGIDARFSASRQPGVCDSSLYDFIDSSQALFDNVVSYKWKFDDGDSSAKNNPSHYYNKPALYNPSLNILTGRGCISTYTIPLNVLIDSTPQITAIIPDSACVNTSVLFSASEANSANHNLSWMWNLGNGSTANTKDTNYTYTTASSYNLFVAGTTAAGCADTIRHTTRIDPLPPVDAGLDSVICKGQSIALNANGASNYNWVQDASLSCINCSSPIADPSFTTRYFLTGTNNFGCKASDSINIEVKQPANVSITAPDTICVGTTIQLQATGAELFSWLPASSVINSTDSLTSSTPQSTTTYTLIGRDSKGCFSDTTLTTVNVFPYPTIQIPDSIITVNAGDEYKMNTTGSADITLWQWTPLSGLSCSNCAQPVIKPQKTQTYSVKASNIAGCSAEKNILITVLCKDQNLFVPNTFSPNGDGMNDYFYPRGKGLFTIKSFKIFNRWGILIFKKDNFPPNQQTYGWDGTFNGKALRSDVFVFIVDVLCENGTVLSSKGNITLLR